MHLTSRAMVRISVLISEEWEASNVFETREKGVRGRMGFYLLRKLSLLFSVKQMENTSMFSGHLVP